MRESIIKKVIIGAMILPALLMANGLNLNGVGSKAISMGGAYVGLADDYSAVFFNPAGLTQIEGTSFSLYFTDVIPTGTYAMDAFGIDATTKSNHYISGAVAAFFDIGPKFKVGFFGDVPSGLGAEWDGNDLRAFSGAASLNFEWLSRIGVFHFGPAFAYQVSEKFSLGATVNIAYGMMDMKRPVDAAGDGLMDVQYDESSTGMGVGFTIGALIKASEKFSFGLTVKTPTTIGFSGSAENAAFAAFNAPESDFDRDITWPLWVGGGIAVKPLENLTVTADVHWTKWSTVDVLETEYADAVWQGAMEPADDHKLKMHWEDQMQIRVGAQLNVSESLAIRAGYYHDPASAPDETVNFLLPNITYNAITFGLGWMSGPLCLDVAFEYLMGSDREITQGADNVGGTHGMNMIVPNIALTYMIPAR